MVDIDKYMEEHQESDSEWVKKMRKNLNLTQRELARSIGVAPNTVTAWESGRRKMSELARRAIELLSLAAESNDIATYTI